MVSFGIVAKNDLVWSVGALGFLMVLMFERLVDTIQKISIDLNPTVELKPTDDSP